MKNRQVLIASVGTAIIGGSAYLGVRTLIRNREFAELMLSIKEDQAQQAGELSYLKAFNPAWVDQSTSGRAISLYTTARVETLCETLHDAIHPFFFGLGTDDKTIYGTYTSIENQKKMSQIAKRYQAKYGLNLLEDITGDLNTAERQQLFSIIANKPEIQYV
jgi:hypothetical protein